MTSTDSSTPANATPSELEALSEKLADRKSIVLFARTYVLSFGSIIALGISIHLLVDKAPAWLFGPIGVIGAIGLSAAAYSFVLGLKRRSQEHLDYARFQELREKAGLTA